MLALAHDECQRGGDKEPVHRKMRWADTADGGTGRAFKGGRDIFCPDTIARAGRGAAEST